MTTEPKMARKNHIDADKKLTLIEKAADTASEGFIITDALKSGNPIIYVNNGFEQLTGYSRSFILGKNCGFLQGEETTRDAIEKIRLAVAEKRECVVELLNYRRNGSPFWNRLSITPLKDETGRVTHFLGIQSDITLLKSIQKKLEIANNELRRFQKDMMEQLGQAQEAQKFILPRILPQDGGINFAVKFVPLTRIGGDFYDIFSLDESRTGILVADVTGHGIPAALLTFMSSNAFKDNCPGDDSTRSVIEKTNRLLTGKMPAGTFVTMFYAIYEKETKTLVYTQAGHPPGFVLRPASGEVITLESEGILMGIVPEKQAVFGEKRIALKKGDKVILYTDAIMEAGIKAECMLDPENLIRFLKDEMNSPVDTLLEHVYQYGLTAAGVTNYDDDVTMVGFEIMV